jgi:chaperonin GroES
MTMRPLRDFVVVSAIVAESKTASGLLHLPGNVDQKVVSGKVLSTGTGRITDSGAVVPMEVKVGDTVLFSKSSSVEIEHQGEKVNLLREDAVLSVLT